MTPDQRPILVVLAGLPGTGKTTIARELARRTGATHLRVDTIEHELTRSRRLAGPVHDLGYRLAYALAVDNLRLGTSVIGDSVNPMAITRQAWRRVATDAGAAVVEVEIFCSDASEHQRRVESRVPDMEGFQGPTWQDVLDRDYEPWLEADVRIDTAMMDLDFITAHLLNAMPGRTG